MIRTLVDAADQPRAYYFNVSFEESLRRHASKPNATAFGELELQALFPGVRRTPAAPRFVRRHRGRRSATLRGLTETEARTVLTAADLNAATTAGASPADVAGLVIDVQPSGQIATGSNVTLIRGTARLLP